jgi:cell division protein ZapE
MNNSPLTHYRHLLSTSSIEANPYQENAIKCLEGIKAKLVERSQLSFLKRLLLPYHYTPIQGLYLWGEVGVGKTFLMDCFYNNVSIQSKGRFHFFNFMEIIHAQLKSLEGVKNPLQKVAKNLSKKYTLLCFDEFFVSDITDAMLLGPLLQHLFDLGMTLVATSNVPPNELYKNGIQRDRFIPAILQIEMRTEVLNVRTIKDYRMEHLLSEGVYFTPLGEEADNKLEALYLKITKDSSDKEPIIILDRPIPVIKKSGDVVWFDFMDLCLPPRGQRDYLLLSTKFRTFFISNIPLIKKTQSDLVCNFIRLVDILYDHGCHLVISAEDVPLNLYTEGRLKFEYSRTYSRLSEMQSQQYFEGNNDE